MQQVNVLSMKVSQNVETKDDVLASNSTSSSDDFSQHIDLHLSKNKEVNAFKNNRSDRNYENKTADQVKENNKLETDTKALEESDLSQAIVEEDSKIDQQEVATDGKRDESEVTKEVTVEVVADEIIDESDVLMSFLTKVDKALIDKPVSDNVSDTNKEISVIVTTNTDEELNNEEEANSLLTAGKNTKENIDSEQRNAKQLIDGKIPTEKNIVDGKLTNANIDQKNMVNQIENVTQLTKNDVSDNEKSVGLNQQTQSKNEQSLINTTEDSKDTKKVAVDNQNNLIQQELKPLGKDSNSDDIVLSKKTSENAQANVNTKTSSEAELKINEQVAKLMENDPTTLAKDMNVNPNTATTVAQSSVGQSSISQNLASQTMNKNTTATNMVEPANSATENTESSEVEPELQLNSELEEVFVAQNKKPNSDNKEASVITKPTTNTDSSLEERNFIGETSRTTQAAYDRIEQQSTDAFNLTGSAEVSQSQKTNTQLHHETISIFRKDFSEAVKDKVMLVISQKLQQFDIVLDPPELGNMQVRVNLQGEQATVNFVVQNQQAKEALEQNMHKLRDSLAEQGVDVGDANVEQQSQQSDTEGNPGTNQRNIMQNTADANDVVEHDLSAIINNTPAKGIDYYA